MTLDEAILHAEEVADKCALTDGNIQCEDDHRQLAEWLRNYKRLLEQEPCEDISMTAIPVTVKEAKRLLYTEWKKEVTKDKSNDRLLVAYQMAIKALEQEPVDKSAMMYEIYMEGVNMGGEYQGCWVRFKDIETIVDKYMEG